MFALFWIAWIFCAQKKTPLEEHIENTTIEEANLSIINLLDTFEQVLPSILEKDSIDRDSTTNQ